MIIEIKENQLDEVVNYCWGIAKDKTRYGFPRFESYAKLHERLLRAVRHPEDKVLAYYEDHVLQGVLNLFVEEKEKYLQGIGGIFTTSDFDIIATHFITTIASNYKGYELYFGFPIEFKEANAYFKAINAKPMDASRTMKLNPQDFICDTETGEVTHLTQDHLEEYGAFHDKQYPAVYWNSTRIIEKLELFHIFYIKRNNRIVGSIFIKQNTPTQLEVYGLSVQSGYEAEELDYKLLAHSLQNTLTPETKEVLFFVDEGIAAEHEAALKTGFKQIDTYRSYKLNI